MSPGPTPGDWARFDKRNVDATHASVEPHLEPGEEALVEQPVRPMEGRMSLLTFPRIEVTPAAFVLPSVGVFVVTPRRFLIVVYERASGEPIRLVDSRPLEDVRSVERTRAFLSTKVSWTADGMHYAVWANPWMAKRIAATLEQQSPG